MDAICISKWSKDPTLSANYRGTSLTSSLSKILEWSILTTWSDYFTTSDLQFGFKSGCSTTLCTDVMKTVINGYLNKGSKVYACLIDASKAFDTADQKLLERRVPKTIVHLLMRWYMTQRMQVQWSGRAYKYLGISNGVHQGGVLSSILVTI